MTPPIKPAILADGHNANSINAIDITAIKTSELIT
jgi:hypothetical protein